MKKFYINEPDYNKHFKDSYGNEWGYYSKNKIKEIYHKDCDNSLKIVGEVIKKNYKPDSIIQNDNKQLGLGNVGYHKRVINKVSGYMKCGEDEYVLVMKKNWLLFFLTLVTLILLIASIIYFSNSSKPIDLDPGASDYVANLEKPENFDSNKISIPGYGEIRAKEGATEAYVALMNPEYNPVYFKFDVILESTGESLIKTKLIPPGKAIKSIPLKKDMKAGSYDILIKIDSYSLENPDLKMNGANVKTKLIILESS